VFLIQPDMKEIYKRIIPLIFFLILENVFWDGKKSQMQVAALLSDSRQVPPPPAPTPRHVGGTATSGEDAGTPGVLWLFYPLSARGWVLRLRQL